MPSGKAVSEEMIWKIIREYSNGHTTMDTAQICGVTAATVRNIVKLYSESGGVKKKMRRDALRVKSSHIISAKTEFYKMQKPSITAKEIQKELIKDGNSFQETVPSESTISRKVTKDLGYTRKKISSIIQESTRPDVQLRLDMYMATMSTKDPYTLHFFDESSVLETTSNRSYGHAPAGTRAFEIQKYASKTINLLHSVQGVDFHSIVNSPSNGLELLFYF